ncbi:MAG: hypothetical protein ACKVTZ_05855 [Bacteroidia bacterium]
MKKAIILLAVCIMQLNFLAAQVRGNAVYERQMKSVQSLGYRSNDYKPMEQMQQSVATRPVSNESANAYFLSDSTFMIEADVMCNRRADSYVAAFSVIQTASTLDSVNLMMNARIEKMLQKLPANINRKEIFIDFISLNPTFEYTTEKKLFSKSTSIETPSGYELIKNIHIAYEKQEQLEEITKAAIQGEIYDLVKVDYVMNEMEGIYDTLRQTAIALVQKKRSDFEKLGVKFGVKFTVVADDITSTYPIERYKSYTSVTSSGTNFDKIKKTYTSSKRHNTYYYDKVNYNEMDKVINPVVVEPVIQFMYNIKIKYSLAK